MTYIMYVTFYIIFQMRDYLNDQNVTYYNISVTYSYTSGVLVDFRVEIPSASTEEISRFEAIVAAIQTASVFGGFGILTARSGLSVFEITSMV